MQVSSAYRFVQCLLLGLSLTLLNACSAELNTRDGEAQSAAAASSSAASSRSRMPNDASLKTLYIQSCYGCHSSGAAGAPRSGNTEQWAPRMQKGLDTLLANTKNGLNSMPPRGMCMNCSDDDYRALILFLSGEAE